MTLLTNRRRLGNLFMALGLLLVLGAGLSLAWGQIQTNLLQARLRHLPPARPIIALDETSTPGAATTALESSPQNMVTETPRPAAVATATPTPSAAVTATPLPAALPAEAGATTPTATSMLGGQPVRIVIPDLGVDVRVTEMDWKDVQTATGTVSEWQIPEYAAGHAVNSALLGQQPGNVVISGHNNIYGRVFMAISEAWGGRVQRVDKVTERSHLLDGRLVTLYAADGRRFDYIITDFLRVQDEGVPLAQRIANAQYIEPTGDTRVTITTCWPPWSNTHRLIVIAKPVSNP